MDQMDFETILVCVIQQWAKVSIMNISIVNSTYVASP